MKKPIGHFIFAHGLNLDPTKLMPLREVVHELGGESSLLTLAGHKSQYDLNILAKLTLENIEDDFIKNYTTHFNDSIFVGQSFGCLIYAKLVAEKRIPEARKNIFFSPAFEIHKILKLSLVLPKNLWIKSKNFVGYRYHDKLPVHLYTEINRASLGFEQDQIMELKNNTLLMIDPKDELVPYKKLLKKIERNSNIKMVTFETHKPYHLIIDQNTTGESWNALTKTMQDFILHEN